MKNSKNYLEFLIEELKEIYKKDLDNLPREQKKIEVDKAISLIEEIKKQPLNLKTEIILNQQIKLLKNENKRN